MNKVQKLFDKLINQYQQKNLAYGNNAHKTFVRFGRAAYSMRLMDKMQRYETLTANPEISSADESVLDTLGDAITYVLMFTADLFCNEDDLNDDSNYRKTLEYMCMLGACDQEDITLMATEFESIWMPQGKPLSIAIYDMYSEYASISEYILLAAYITKIYIEVTKE